MEPKDKVREFYENEATQYDTRWVSRGGEETSKRQLKIVKELTQNWENREIVELGCGSGRFSSYIQSIASKAYFFDLTMAMLLESRRKLLPNGLGFNGVTGSAYKIPLPAKSIDCLISINVFNHIQDTHQALLEVNRILKPGGIMLVNFTNLKSLFILPASLVNMRGKSIGRDVYAKWFTPSQIDKALDKSGFVIEKCVGNVFIPKYLEITLIRDLLLFIDPAFRKSVLKKYAPAIFYRCIKKQIETIPSPIKAVKDAH